VLVEFGLNIGRFLKAAAGSFTGTVVLRRANRAAKMQYTPCVEQLASVVGDEGRSVIALEDQGWSVLLQQFDKHF
jgi:hypothetical protein